MRNKIQIPKRHNQTQKNLAFSTKNTLEIVKIAVSSSAKATINSVSGENVQLNKYFWMLRIAMFISRVKNNYSNKLELI